MLKRIKLSSINQKQKMGVIIVAIIIFIIAVVIFVEIEIDHNRKVFINNYMEEQQCLSDQVAIRMESYIKSGNFGMSEIISKIASEVQASGSRFWFITQNDQFLFVKNEASTDLFRNISLATFLSDRKTDGMKLSSSSFAVEEDKYTIGICTKGKFIDDQGQLFRHNIYIILPLALICSVFLAVFIAFLLKIYQQENKISQLSSEAMERNMTIEQLSVRIKKSRLNDLGGLKKPSSEETEAMIYSKDVLTALLEKIKRENVVPLTIVVIELMSNNQNTAPPDYKNIFKSVSKVLTMEYILAEILPGVFSIIMFYTSSEQMVSIKKILINQWALPLKKQGIKVRIGISFIEDNDVDVESVFDTVCKEVSEKIKFDSKVAINS